MRNQVEELLTNYGEIDILWFDFSYAHHKTPADRPWAKGKGKDDWEAEKLIALARKIRPGIIINNRSGVEQDIYTPEQYQPQEWIRHAQTGELVNWEACQTFSGSWGYYRDENTWKSPEMLINMLINTVSLGGNLIMNVGPTSRGYFDYRAENALKVYAEWMKYNSRSIYGCTMAEKQFIAPNGCKLTQSVDGKRLYIHVVDYPFKELHVLGLKDKIDYVQFLHDGSEILFSSPSELFHNGEAGKKSEQQEQVVVFKLPIIKPNTLIPVIEIFLK